MNTLFRLAFAALALIVAALTVLAILQPERATTQNQAQAPANAVSPRPTVAASPEASSERDARPLTRALDAEVTLRPGAYTIKSPSLPSMTIDIPNGWQACSEGPEEQSVCGNDGAVSFLIVHNVVVDPCGTALLDPPVGPSVNDLARAIAHLDGFRAIKPIHVTIDGRQGKQFAVTAPATTSCDLKTWATAGRTNGVGPGEVNLLHIIDVDGVRVMIAAAYAQTSGAPGPLLELEHVLTSIRIGP